MKGAFYPGIRDDLLSCIIPRHDIDHRPQSLLSMTHSPLLRSKLFWVGLLYFAEGLPLGIFYDLFPVQFRQQGVSLSAIGMLSLFGLAWTLKFLWAPAVDHYRHHRRWIIAVNFGMGALLLLFAMQQGFGPWVWLGIGLFTLLSATNDSAIDGYTIEQLDKRELGLANGIRIAFYRVGMLAAGLLLVLSDHIGWPLTYLSATLLFALLALVIVAAPKERSDIVRATITLGQELRTLLVHPLALTIVLLFFVGAGLLADRSIDWSRSYPYVTTHYPALWQAGLALAGLLLLVSFYRHRTATTPFNRAMLTEGPMFGALFEMVQRPGIMPVILFILLFKLGDAAMGFMVKPFWVDAGFSATQIGLVSVQLSLALSIAGGIAGGWFTDRFGIFRALWMLGLLQALSNLGYAGVATLLPLGASGSAPSTEHQMVMYLASGLESFTGGLGTAAFLAFLMAIVDKRRSAAEYALLSSLFALSRSLAGFASGFGAEALGYAPYFLLTFFLAFPAYLLLPWVLRMLQRSASHQEATP